MISEKTLKLWEQKRQTLNEEKEKVCEFILFLMEKYDLDGIDPMRLG